MMSLLFFPIPSKPHDHTTFSPLSSLQTDRKGLFTNTSEGKFVTSIELFAGEGASIQQMNCKYSAYALLTTHKMEKSYICEILSYICI